MLKSLSPSGAPSAHPESGWRKSARSTHAFTRLETDRETGTLIVGGGFTGLSTARELLHRGADCLLVEACDIGWGASGRTGGFLVPRYKSSFATLAKTYGNDTVRALLGQAVQAVDSVAGTVADFSLDCGFQHRGHITAAHSRTALAGLESDIAWLRAEANDTRVHILSRDETAEALASPVYHGAYLDPRGACLHPYDYARGLATGLGKRGVPIFAGSPVEALRREADGWVAETPDARVRARTVVLATNGYTGPLTSHDDLYMRLVPVASSVVTTRPLTADEWMRTLPAELPVSDTRRILNYFRKLPGGQLLFGGRGDLTGRRTDPSAFRGLERKLARTFPHLAGIEIESRWSGMVAVTLDGFPHAGQLDADLYYALGYGGRGVALSSLMGRHLAAMVAGEPVELGPMGDCGFAPIPFHTWQRTGMRAMSGYYRIRDFFER